MLDFLFAAALLAQDVDPAGRYTLQDGPSSCTLRLQPSLPGLPEALVEGDAKSGFAFASPGCPEYLQALSLWRYERESRVLTLVDGAGETLVTARQTEQAWQGETVEGRVLQLIRD